jgi:signal transduction histidine kinase
MMPSFLSRYFRSGPRPLTADGRSFEAVRIDAVRSAVYEERKRIALDMHDDMGHRLTVALFQVDQALAQAAGDEEQIRNLRVVRRKLTDCMDALRTLPWATEDEELSQRDLRKALELLVSEIPETTGLAIDLHFEGDCESITNPTRSAAIRIAQEAVTNALKYANASLIRLDVCRTDTVLLLTVADDGKGIDQSDLQEARTSLGLHSMQNRSRNAGGHIEIHSTPSQGTRIVATFPVSGGY